jgi:alkylation response protein AidB-like acyl-CoA dehydrogenase
MDLTLTEDQKMLQSTVQELMRRDFPKETLVELDAGKQNIGALWAKLASTGLLGSLIPEEYGGVGGSLTDTAVIYEELGRGPVPGPHFSSGVLGALTLVEAGTPEQKQSLLPGVAQGTTVLALAVTEADYGWSAESVLVTAAKHGDTYALNGVKLHVADAATATHLIVAARLGDIIGLFIVDASARGVAVRELAGLATGACEVRLENAEASLIGDGGSDIDGWVVLERVFQKALPVLCAYQVGAISQVFDMSLLYSQTRHQFQQAIGRFQRVQDHVIDIVNQLDAARWTTYEALWKLDTGKPDAAASVHMAAAAASEAYYVGCNSAHDVHAGVGIVREYGLTLHTKMSRTLYHYLGNPRHHKRKLAEALEL